MADKDTAVHFPHAGVDQSGPVSRQPARKLPDGDYARTCVAAQNVRAYEAGANRRRGGSRPGLSKYLAGQVAGQLWVVQDLAPITLSGITVPGGAVPQSSQAGRVVLLVAVSRGNVYTTTPPGGGVWTAATNNTGNTPPLNFTGLVRSACNQQKMQFADGTNWCYFDPSTNSVEAWTASAGSLPVDGDGNTPRLICTWRGRTMVSGLLKDGQNWFATAAGTFRDFDYAPATPSATQAVAGNNSRFGLIGDMITALIPYSDDVLVFGGDSSIYLMRGDPAAGGEIDLVTETIGMAWGQAWCQGPDGTIYFFSNRTGVFALQPGQQPQRISGALDNYLYAINTGTHGVRMAWSDRYQGLHLYVTPLAAPAATTHFFWEQRTGGWFPDVFANRNHDPLCCCALDGNLPTDRVTLTGGWDGYVRAVDQAAADDDGTPIASAVFIGPFLTPTAGEVMLRELTAVLGETSGAVTWEVFVGSTAEVATTRPAAAAGVLRPGRNLTKYPRVAGHAIYLRLSSTVRWAMESIRITLGDRGMVRQRSA
jgi:hypothetical protein